MSNVATFGLLQFTACDEEGNLYSPSRFAPGDLDTDGGIAAQAINQIAAVLVAANNGSNITKRQVVLLARRAETCQRRMSGRGGPSIMGYEEIIQRAVGTAQAVLAAPEERRDYLAGISELADPRRVAQAIITQ